MTFVESTSSSELGTRDWTKWNLEHPWIDKDRTKSFVELKSGDSVSGQLPDGTQLSREKITGVSRGQGHTTTIHTASGRSVTAHNAHSVTVHAKNPKTDAGFVTMPRPKLKGLVKFGSISKGSGPRGTRPAKPFDSSAVTHVGHNGPADHQWHTGAVGGKGNADKTAADLAAHQASLDAHKASLPSTGSDHLTKQAQFVRLAGDRSSKARAAKLASMPRGKQFTGTGPMTDAQYAEHRDHVAFVSTQHGSDHLETSRFSTHITQDFVHGQKGHYTAEREAQHEAIIQHLLSQSSGVPHDRVGLITGGLGGAGKMVPLSSPVPTPTGWTTIGEIREGDTVFDADGRPTTVLALSAIDEMPVSFRITFDDGTVQDACADHQWLTFNVVERAALHSRTPEWRAARRARRASQTKASANPGRSAATMQRNLTANPSVTKPAPEGSVLTTKDIASTVRNVRGEANHGVPMAGALVLPEADLPVDPYVLGAWLGDGASAAAVLTSADQEIVDQIRAAGEHCVHKGGYRYSLSDGVKTGKQPKPESLLARLRGAGLLGNKHIPLSYLRAGLDQRLSLLQGLMDTDGTIDKRSGRVSFCTTSPALRDGVEELVLSLGWKVRAAEGRAKIDGRDCGPKWTIHFSPTETVFRLSRKAMHQKMPTTNRTRFRLIVSVEEVAPVPMRCLTVANARGLFLVGRRFLVTHNSTILRKNAQHPDSVASKLGIKYASYATADDAANHVSKGDGIGDPTNFLTLNPDIIKEEMLKRGMIPNIPGLSPAEQAGFIHEESSHINDRLTERAIDSGTNVIHDVTLNSVKSGMKRIPMMKNAGYKVGGVFVDVTPGQSIKNAEARHRGGHDRLASGKGGFGGRYVPSDLIAASADKTGKFLSNNRQAFETMKAQGAFDKSITVDNENHAGIILDEQGSMGHG